MAMIEPFISHRVDGRVRNDLAPEAMIRAVAIASGLGTTSAYTWLKVPVVDGYGAGHGRLHAARPAARRRGRRRPRSDVRRLAEGAAAAERRWAWWPGGRCCTRPTATWPPPWTPRSACCEGARARVEHRPAPPGRQPGRRAVAAVRHPGAGRLGLLRAARARPAAGRSHEFGTGADEVVSCRWPDPARSSATASGSPWRAGPSVFSGVTDFAYLPRDARARVQSGAGGRFALPGARAARRLPPRYGPAAGVPVELRGAGACSRQVNNFCMPGAFEADRLIACEVITPAGNWSSYPPHKHDEERPGESVLEEIYYFEIAAGPGWPWRRLPARLRDARTGRSTCSPRSGRRRRADPARLARPVDGGPRLRHVLPERDGRARRRAGLADLRRPGARLGPRHLAGPAASTRGCP